jgi:hypothetical protein
MRPPKTCSDCPKSIVTVLTDLKVKLETCSECSDDIQRVIELKQQNTFELAYLNTPCFGCPKFVEGIPFQVDACVECMKTVDKTVEDKSQPIYELDGVNTVLARRNNCSNCPQILEDTPLAIGTCLRCSCVISPAIEGKSENTHELQPDFREE